MQRTSHMDWRAGPRLTGSNSSCAVRRACCILSVRIRDHDVQASLHAAIKEELKLNPNYGKATGLGATRWWENVRPPPAFGRCANSPPGGGMLSLLPRR